jgi:hypothetical protein
MAKDELEDYHIEGSYGLYQWGKGKAHIARIPVYSGVTIRTLCGYYTPDNAKPKQTVITRGEVCKRCRHLYNYDK